MSDRESTYKPLRDLFSGLVDAEEKRLKELHQRRVGATAIFVVADVCAVALAWSLWGWRGAALLFCIGLSMSARKFKKLLQR